MPSRVERLDVRAYEIPTATDVESDGTLEWRSTTLVVVEARAGGKTGLGYTYCDAAAAKLIQSKLREHACAGDPMCPEDAWYAMQDAVRNVGRAGIAACAISAVDTALWDLRARLLDRPLAHLFGRGGGEVALYGSGGFVNYTERELCEQLSGWAERGFGMVKMKVGRHPEADEGRVAAARRAIGDRVELFVDANGAYSRKQAIGMAHRFAEHGVTWFEEPVSSDDVSGLRYVRDQTPPGVNVTAGEYGYDRFHFRNLLVAEAVDVLQADATRCLGYSGFLRAQALAETWPIPLSAHCAPQLHVHVCAGARGVAHVEYFFDHQRIERLLFDGALEPKNGRLHIDASRPGNGLSFKHADAEKYRL